MLKSYMSNFLATKFVKTTEIIIYIGDGNED